MTDLAEFRNSAVQRWLGGDVSELVELVKANKLNTSEREFVSLIVSGNAPMRQRGRKRKSRNPVRAGLIRFWLMEYPPLHNKDAVHFEISRILRVSETMARKYLDQIDNPKTFGQAEIAELTRWRIDRAKVMIECLGIGGTQELKAEDLKPISNK